MKVSFHIGTGKAGSSSIQRFLADNKTILEAHRTCYLGLNLERQRKFNSNPQNWQVVNGWANWRSRADRIDEYVKAIHEQIEALWNQGYKQLIVSNESIFGTYLEFEHILTALRLKGHYIHIITVLRRPHEWIKSAYLQWGIVDKAYSGSVPSFREWGKKNLPAFANELRKWYDSQKIDKIDIVNLDSCDNLIQRFCELIQIENPGCENIRFNESRQPHELYLRWLLASHTRDKQSPHRGDTILKQLAAVNFDASSKLTFSDLWDEGMSTEEIDKLCDRQASLLNEILLQTGSELFPLSDKQPPKGFGALDSADVVHLQDSILAALLFAMSLMQQKISLLEQIVSTNACHELH